MPKVYYGFLQERTGSPYWESNLSANQVIEHTARLGPDYEMIALRSLPVAHARNAHCQYFMAQNGNGDGDDVLVMMDVDHIYPPDIVPKLAAHPPARGVVCGLAVARGETPFVCFFGANDKGNMTAMSAWQQGEIAEGWVGGTGAIAIKRWVLWALYDRAPSWFRYIYGGYEFEPTDEMDFGYACHRRGIKHYCDTNIWIPHVSVEFRTPDDWHAYVQAHPEVRDVYREGRAKPPFGEAHPQTEAPKSTEGPFGSEKVDLPREEKRAGVVIGSPIAPGFGDYRGSLEWVDREAKRELSELKAREEEKAWEETAAQALRPTSSSSDGTKTTSPDAASEASSTTLPPTPIA